MKRQIDMLTDKELLFNLYLTQFVIFVLAVILGVFSFPSWQQFFLLFRFHWQEIILIGGGMALLVIVVDLLLYCYLPKKWLDDGGINERIFAKRTIFHIFFIALIVSFCEELLFRGILQTKIGYVWANGIFAIIHFRYLKKPIIFMLTVGVSFLLGASFLVTNNLFVPMFAHFLIDFILGTFIMIKTRWNKWN